MARAAWPEARRAAAAGADRLARAALRVGKAIDEEVKCLALGRDDITRILGDKIQSIMYNNSIKWAFESNPILSKLTKIQIEKILLKIT